MTSTYYETKETVYSTELYDRKVCYLCLPKDKQVILANLLNTYDSVPAMDDNTNE